MFVHMYDGEELNLHYLKTDTWNVWRDCWEPVFQFKFSRSSLGPKILTTLKYRPSLITIIGSITLSFEETPLNVIFSFLYYYRFFFFIASFHISKNCIKILQKLFLSSFLGVTLLERIHDGKIRALLPNQENNSRNKYA